jgi:hypothetical protein
MYFPAGAAKPGEAGDGGGGEGVAAGQPGWLGGAPLPRLHGRRHQARLPSAGRLPRPPHRAGLGPQHYRYGLKVLTNEKKGGLIFVSFDRSGFKLFTLKFSNNMFSPYFSVVC